MPRDLLATQPSEGTGNEKVLDVLRDQLGVKQPRDLLASNGGVEPDSLADIGGSILPALGRGTADLAGLPGTLGGLLEAGVGKGIEMATGYKPVALPNPLGGDAMRDYLSTATGGASEHRGQGRIAKDVGTAAEFIPGAAAFGGASLPNLLRFGVLPGVASEEAGRATKGTAYEPYARIAAALAAPGAATLASRAITPFPASAERLNMADALRREGVDLTAGQRTGSNTLRNIEAELGGMPGQAMVERQGEQFTRAALGRAGIDAPRATPEVMDQAFTRIGNEFDTLAAQTRIPFDQRFQDDLLDAASTYIENTGASAQAPLIENIMNDAAQLSRAGTLDGAAYARLRTRITDGLRRGDSNTRGALTDMREALDDAVERSLPADAVERWTTARNQYRNMLVLEQAATGAGEAAASGLITPSSLRNATVQKHGRRNYARGEGDFADLARAGEATMRPLPNSGTAGRSAARNIGQGSLSILGALAGHGMADLPGMVAGMAAGSAVPAAIGRAVLSRPGRAYLSNQLVGAQNLADPRLAAIAAALLGDQQRR